MFTGRDKKQSKNVGEIPWGEGGGKSHELFFKKRLRQRKYREAEPFA